MLKFLRQRCSIDDLGITVSGRTSGNDVNYSAQWLILSHQTNSYACSLNINGNSTLEAHTMRGDEHGDWQGMSHDFLQDDRQMCARRSCCACRGDCETLHTTISNIYISASVKVSTCEPRRNFFTISRVVFQSWRMTES